MVNQLAKVDGKQVMKWVAGAGAVAGGAVHLASALNISTGDLGSNMLVLLVGGGASAYLGVMHLMK